MSHFRSNGKLLITGEYVVLDGGSALALPSVYGQSLDCASGKIGQIQWNAKLNSGQLWFSIALNITNPSKIRLINADQFSQEEIKKGQTLIRILEEAHRLNPGFLQPDKGYAIETTLEFPTDWGLGSSSTLINNIANWAKVNPYTLLWNSFTGSGYDIACAQHLQPLIYKLEQGQPTVTLVDFKPVFSEAIHFVYLNKKQNSREGIKRYHEISCDPVQKNQIIKSISELTMEITKADSLAVFDELLLEHEKMISAAIALKPVKEKYFSDFKGGIKSLGAWGGDFILATGQGEYVEHYFKKRGFNTVISYNTMVLKS